MCEKTLPQFSSTRLTTNFLGVFFLALKERKKRGDYLPPYRKVWTKIRWWNTLPHMHRRRSTRSSGALRDTRILFPTYWSTCGSTFIGNFAANCHERFTSTKAILRVFFGPPIDARYRDEWDDVSFYWVEITGKLANYIILYPGVAALCQIHFCFGSLLV